MILDNVPKVLYSRRTKALVYLRFLDEWLIAKRVMTPMYDGSQCILYIDITSGQNLTAEAKDSLKVPHALMRFLKKISTDFCQPTDSFIIPKMLYV